MLVNRQPLKRARDLLGVLRVTVFAPDDLELVKGGPGERRRYLDDALVALAPALRRRCAARSTRSCKQRNALLKGAGGRLDDDAAFTLDVWDAKLAEAGGRLAEARQALLERLGAGAGRDLRRGRQPARPRSRPPTWPTWAGVGLEAALAASRADDLRRGVSTVGPHRDDVDLAIGGLPARTHASQGEQRSLALALRLASHHVVTEVTGSAPVLLLDDVFSELDPDRSDALLANLPAGQTLLTSASGLPPKADARARARGRDGRIDAGGVRPSTSRGLSGGRTAATMARCPLARCPVTAPEPRPRRASRSTP